MAATKKTGFYKGKSNALGFGGRSAQLRDEGVPGAVIGAIARRKGAAPGGPNYHGGQRFSKGGRVKARLAEIGLMPTTRESSTEELMDRRMGVKEAPIESMERRPKAKR